MWDLWRWSWCVEVISDFFQACPPGGKKLCARNLVTKQLGTFESDCVFGRYNNCVKTTESKAKVLERMSQTGADNFTFFLSSHLQSTSSSTMANADERLQRTNIQNTNRNSYLLSYSLKLKVRSWYRSACENWEWSRRGVKLSDEISSRRALRSIESMKLPSFQKQIITSPSSSMAVKLSTLAILLTLCYTILSAAIFVQKVPMPNGCASACPPQRDPQRFICARSRISKKLGMFDGECFFGRYNHCSFVREREYSIN